MPNKTTLIHVSDLHFTNNCHLIRGFLDHKALFSKRHIGWLNYRLNRRQKFDSSYKIKLLDKLKSLQWDYLIISGDLTTLSLKSEFEDARNALAPLIERGPILLTPGNHDRYIRTKTQEDLLLEYFGDCWPFNTRKKNGARETLLEIEDQAVIVEMDMAVPRPPFSSRGKLRQNLDLLATQLKNIDKKQLKIAIGHYPAFIPETENEGYFHRLSKRSSLQEFLFQQGFDFYLHGHIHKSWCFKPDPERSLTCINSGGCCCEVQQEWRGFHRITINGDDTHVDRIYP